MCLLESTIVGIERWNWDGDYIVHRPIVPSARGVPGYERLGEYDVDPRNYLLNGEHEVIRDVYNNALKKYVESVIGGNWDYFNSKGEGAFDYKAYLIASFVGKFIDYDDSSKNVTWLYPYETLHVRRGDCEDLAFLMASLMISAGISDYNIRVALGNVELIYDQGEKESHDHLWVMYKNEIGKWSILEPLEALLSNNKAKKGKTKNSSKKGLNKQKKKQILSTEYIPYFVFNNQHLWGIKHIGENRKCWEHLSFNKKWSRFAPAFKGEIHQTILNEALGSILNESGKWVLNRLNSTFSRAAWLVGPIVEDIDRDLKNYDPIEHFDNGYIKEGWELVQYNLGLFKENNDIYFANFGKAAHAIADFYSHSSYPHFARIKGSGSNKEYVELYDPDKPLEGLHQIPQYGATSAINLSNSGPFSINKAYPRALNSNRVNYWNGKIISGRYGQSSDTQGFLIGYLTEGQSYIPKELVEKNDFWRRATLPHHHEIGLDTEKRSSSHELYTSASVYKKQFKLRKNSAIKHIRKVFEENWNGN